MRVEVVTPTGAAASREVEEVVAPGALGELGILPGHVALLSALRPGVLTLRGAGPTEVFAVGAGFVQVTGDDSVVVLSDRAQRAEEIDVKAAEKAFTEADHELAEWTDEQNETYDRLVTQRAWSQAAIDAAHVVGAASAH